MKSKKGFTLVELLAVIVILAILATAAFTLVLPQIEKSRKKSFVSEVASIIDSAELYFLEHPTELKVKIEDLKPYIKNYDSSKAGCVIAPTSTNNNYQVRFSNGDYKTDGTAFYEIGDLKSASGAASDKVVKIDRSHPDFGDGCVTQSEMMSYVFNAASKCKKALPKSFRQDCISVDSLYEHGFFQEDLYIECKKNFRYNIQFYGVGYLAVSGGLKGH